MIKLSSEGTIEWQKTYGTPAPDSCHQVVAHPDGAYTLLGFTKYYGMGLQEMWIIRITEDGSVLNVSAPDFQILDGTGQTFSATFTADDDTTAIQRTTPTVYEGASSEILFTSTATVTPLTSP